MTLGRWRPGCELGQWRPGHNPGPVETWKLFRGHTRPWGPPGLPGLRLWPPLSPRTPGSRTGPSFPALCPGAVLWPFWGQGSWPPRSWSSAQDTGDVPGAECRWGPLSSPRACRSWGAAAPQKRVNQQMLVQGVLNEWTDR